jgi:hypothetical protein
MAIVIAGFATASHGRAQSPVAAPIPLPIVIAADIPHYSPLAKAARIDGTVSFRVTTDGTRVVAVEAIQSNAILSRGAFDNLRTWRFSPHRPVQFETSFRFSLIESTRCFQPAPLTRDVPFIRMDLPGSVEIRAARDVICDGGDVAATARAIDPFERIYGVRVVADPVPRFEPLPMKKAPPRELWVEHASVIGYPIAAREVGIEGIVRLAVSPWGFIGVIEGPATLAEPTAAAVRTWTLHHPSRSAEIRFLYKLSPGECEGGGPTIVSNTSYTEITVTAKRPVKCDQAQASK